MWRERLSLVASGTNPNPPNSASISFGSFNKFIPLTIINLISGRAHILGRGLEISCTDPGVFVNWFAAFGGAAAAAAVVVVTVCVVVVVPSRRMSPRKTDMPISSVFTVFP